MMFKAGDIVYFDSKKSFLKKYKGKYKLIKETYNDYEETVTYLAFENFEGCTCFNCMKSFLEEDTKLDNKLKSHLPSFI